MFSDINYFIGHVITYFNLRARRPIPHYSQFFNNSLSDRVARTVHSIVGNPRRLAVMVMPALICTVMIAGFALIYFSSKRERQSLVSQIEVKDLKEEIAKGGSLLDIYAQWCGPFKILAPLLEKVAQDVKGKAKLVKLGGDQFRKNKIIGGLKFEFYPSLILFKDGKEIRRIAESERDEKTIAKIVLDACGK